jgi:cysteine dioxygenase
MATTSSSAANGSASTLISGLVPSHPVEITPKSATEQAAIARFPKLAAILTYLQAANSRIDLEVLSELLRSTHITKADIAEACQFSDRAYARNTIARSEHFELLALCWNSCQITPVHDHLGSSCAFKVIQGTGTEIRYRKCDAGVVCPVESISMEPGYVCAAQDEDIHQVANLQAAGQELITLHIYTPPIKNMHIYELAGPKQAAFARATSQNVGDFADSI